MVAQWAHRIMALFFFLFDSSSLAFRLPKKKKRKKKKEFSLFTTASHSFPLFFSPFPSLVDMLFLFVLFLALVHGQVGSCAGLRPDNVGGGSSTAFSAADGSPYTPPSSVPGWNVGTGACNGYFSISQSSTVQLGLRAIQRSQGPFAPVAPGVYFVQKGADASNAARAWWNFEFSVAVTTGTVAGLSNVLFDIVTLAGSPSATSNYNFVPITLQDRHGQGSGVFPSPTTTPTNTFVDLFQGSQNPVFPPWFTGFSNNVDGAYLFRLRAGGVETAMCVYNAPTLLTLCLQAISGLSGQE